MILHLTKKKVLVIDMMHYGVCSILPVFALSDYSVVKSYFFLFISRELKR